MRMEIAKSIAHFVYAHFILSMLLGRLGKRCGRNVAGSRFRSRAEMVMVYWSLPAAGFSGREYVCAGVSGGSVVMTSTSVVRRPVKAGSGLPAWEFAVPSPPPDIALS